MSQPNDIVHEKLSSPSDIILRSAPMEGAKDGPATLFHMHKAQLAPGSSVFADLLTIGSGEDKNQPRMHGIPVAQLSENARVLALLCNYIEGDIDTFPDMSSLDFYDLLGLYDASIKFCLALVQSLVESALREKLKDQSFDRCKRACLVYVKASNLSRNGLANRAGDVIFEFEVAVWPEEILGRLDRPQNLLTLVGLPKMLRSEAKELAIQARTREKVRLSRAQDLLNSTKDHAGVERQRATQHIEILDELMRGLENASRILTQKGSMNFPLSYVRAGIERARRMQVDLKEICG